MQINPEYLKPGSCDHSTFALLNKLASLWRFQNVMSSICTLTVHVLAQRNEPVAHGTRLAGSTGAEARSTWHKKEISKLVLSVSHLAEPARKPDGSTVCLQEGKDFSCSSSLGWFKKNALWIFLHLHCWLKIIYCNIYIVISGSLNLGVRKKT